MDSNLSSVPPVMPSPRPEMAVMIGLGLVVWELIGAFFSDLPAEPIEAVSRDLHVDFPVAAFVCLIVAGCAWVATALWMIMASVAGALRLSADRPMGRTGAAA